MDPVSLYARLAAHAADRADSVAIQDHARGWTWADLFARAGAYREALSEADVSEGQTVPILVDRSGETVAAILGALLGGHAFCPLSADQPTERLGACLRALGATVALVTPGSTDALPGPLPVAGLTPAPDRVTDQAPRFPQVAHDRLLYVLFTSGSTGTPKGVMVTHGNIENTMSWSEDVLDWRAGDVAGNVAPFFFDISMFDLFSCLYFDIPMAIVSNASDVFGTLDEIAAHRISSIFSAPVFFSQFLRTEALEDARLGSLRRIVSGGDFFPANHMLGWRAARPQTAIWNVWGPTETSIVNTMHRVGPDDLPRLEDGKSPPVGRATPRMRFVLLNGEEPVSDPWTPGEICMLGDCVTAGYLADRERSREVYFEWNGERAFRTRDLGMLDEDGNLYMVGRIGSMVKIAGYRVDLGEVESAATRIDGVLFAGAFVVEAQEGLQQLHLGIEPRAGAALEPFAVKQKLRTLLPAYMVPKRLHIRPSLPKTANGKLDRRAMVALATGQPAKGDA